MNKKTPCFLVACTSWALLLAGCQGQKQTADHKSITLMQTSELLSMDTSNHADFTTWNVLENSMEGLYKMDRHHQVVPAAAAKVAQPTNNGTTYTIPLRKKARWSNGDPVTANDFVQAWRRSAAPQAKSGYNYIFAGIKNATAISAGQKKPDTLGVKAVDRFTLQVQLEHPLPYFSQLLVMPAFFPESQQALAKFGSRYGTNSKRLYSNGPFVLTKWDGTSDRWTLKKNPYYYAAHQIKLQKINYLVIKDPNTAHELFSQQKLDDALITGVTAKELQKDPHLLHEHRAGNYYLRVNLASGQPLTNQKMRQALSLAVNRKTLTKQVLADGSKPATTYTAHDLVTDPQTGKDFASANQPQKSYNPTEARKLWQEGCQEAHLSGKVQLQVVGNDDNITRKVAEFLQGTFQKNLPQAQVQLKNIPEKNSSELTKKGQFALGETMWLADFADPMSFMGILTSDNPQNYGHYHDESFDHEYQAALTASANDKTAYWQHLHQMQQRLNQTMPVIPLYQMVESHLVNPQLHGVLRHPVGEDDYTRAYLK
ncbi:peptide ABC transporter substrate-binding protein [Lactobacillus sp. DCY120]|uniref:Peptide ABC transporter substrate-binding protein n=1 Tax=Bombilactobacillus apium TaxID=2675299 RepID=A0A850QZK7_9LACO|nr:peptide ABC transporter substrate-binding protein [Bombilactobacillus apium]NVY96219.1 peptide ABC transporter substrate-binding protein [Bombilactobacillus apium]